MKAHGLILAMILALASTAHAETEPTRMICPAVAIGAASVTPTQITPESRQDVAKAFAEVEKLNRMQEKLAASTDQLMARAAAIRTGQRVSELKFFLSHGMKEKVIKSIQADFMTMELRYHDFILSEGRFNELSEKKSRSLSENFELTKIKRQRRDFLTFIGRHFVDYRALDSTLQDYLKLDDDNTLHKDADWVYRNLSLSKGFGAKLPELASLQRPPMETLQALFSGSYPGLVGEERMMALKAQLQRDLTVQRIENMSRRIAGFLGDESLISFFHSVTLGYFSEVEIPIIKEDDDEEPDAAKIITKVGQVTADAYAVADHYPGIDKLLDTKLSMQQRFDLFMQLNALHGNLSNGVPSFMVTMARRPDPQTYTTWGKLKDFVKEKYPDFVVGPKTTLLDWMNQAEETRAQGLLPSVFNPRKATSFAAAKNVMLAAAILSGSYAAFDTLFGESPNDAIVSEFNKVLGLDTEHLIVTVKTSSGETRYDIPRPRASEEKK